LVGHLRGRRGKGESASGKRGQSVDVFVAAKEKQSQEKSNGSNHQLRKKEKEINTNNFLGGSLRDTLMREDIGSAETSLDRRRKGKKGRGGSPDCCLQGKRGVTSVNV